MMHMSKSSSTTSPLSQESSWVEHVAKMTIQKRLARNLRLMQIFTKQNFGHICMTTTRSDSHWICDEVKVDIEERKATKARLSCDLWSGDVSTCRLVWLHLVWVLTEHKISAVKFNNTLEAVECEKHKGTNGSNGIKITQPGIIHASFSLEECLLSKK